MTSVEEPDPDTRPSPPLEAGLSPTGTSLELNPASPEAVEEVKPKKPGPRSPWDTRHEFAHVDRIFIITFPIAFVSFNILYWSLCVYFQDSLRGGD